MSEDAVLKAIVMDEDTLYALAEIKERFSIHDALLAEMLEQGVIDTFHKEEDAYIDQRGLQRIQITLNLHHDLGVNVAGAALALQLMDELDTLRAVLAVMQKHFK